MSINPFASVKDYPSMLIRIGEGTFVASLLALIVLRMNVPAIESALSPFTTRVPILGGFDLPMGTVLPAAAIALLSRVLRLHDLISDAFRVRQRFDLHEILSPLAIGSGATITLAQFRQIANRRKQLMQDVFYTYASSGERVAKIDPHTIGRALDQWGWYWVVAETTFVALITSCVLLLAGVSSWASVLLILSLCLLCVLQFLRAECATYALAEVVRDPQGRNEAERDRDGLQCDTELTDMRFDLRTQPSRNVRRPRTS